jgi:3-phenylpropionate/cinnamic acid dioxygenase small subunit
MTVHPSDATEPGPLLRVHEDERQIRNLVARLAHLADYGELDEYMTLFTEDAIWEGLSSPETPQVGVTNQGAAAIRADREQRRRKGGQGAGAHIRHLNAALWVEVDGSDVATAHSYFAYIRDADTTPTLGLTGRYQDTLRRTPEGWKLAHRCVSLAD